MRMLKYALKNIARNSFLSFSSILVISLMVFFINILFFLQYVSGSLINNINDRLSISVNLRDGYTNDNSEVIEFITELKHAETSMDVSYISSQEAFSILAKRDPELAKVIENDKDNPLPSSVFIKNIPLKEYEKVDVVIKRYKNVIQYDEEKSAKTVTNYSSQYQRIQSLINVLLSIEYGIYGIIAFFVFSVFIIIYNTIGNFVFFHKDEIKIIQLVGGGSRFIYGPFGIQGIIYTLAAYILSTVIFYYIVKNINFSLIVNFPLFVDKFFLEYGNCFLLEFLVILTVWLLSGLLSSKRFIARSLSA